eukprot:TRINITY_DN9075_c0_g1_i1.p1 TRINITY_DN9075_c0_g1~~TRINITY_DN9075_c0_g1_i1.p1  ORF type:complete len:110 (-),score=25.78 TRINITY_DN9075_c0_g1_i1:171-500(-)
MEVYVFNEFKGEEILVEKLNNINSEYKFKRWESLKEKESLKNYNKNLEIYETNVKIFLPEELQSEDNETVNQIKNELEESFECLDIPLKPITEEYNYTVKDRLVFKYKN